MGVAKPLLSPTPIAAPRRQFGDGPASQAVRESTRQRPGRYGHTSPAPTGSPPSGASERSGKLVGDRGHVGSRPSDGYPGANNQADDDERDGELAAVVLLSGAV